MSGQQQRKLKNLLVTPRFQLKLCGYFFASGMIFFVAVLVVAYQKLIQVRSLMNDNPVMNFMVQSEVNDLMFETVQFALVGFVLYIVFTSVFALIMSHRIAGPVIAITAFIDQLREGNFDYKRNLRPKDELKEIMEALQHLAPALKERLNRNEGG